MIWYNWMYAWFTLNSESNFFYSDIYKAWMFVEYEKYLENWIDRTYEDALIMLDIHKRNRNDSYRFANFDYEYPFDTKLNDCEKLKCIDKEI
jgi:hypothetical protein